METYINQPHERFESDSLHELFTALSKAQGEMEAASANAKNTFHKSDYSNLYGLVVSSRPHLAKNGLAVIQRIVEVDKRQYLYTRLCHSSGQWMESKVALAPQKQDIQSLGSYITYQRRYSYGAIVGIVVKDDKDDPNDDAGKDDDGNKAMLEEDLPKKGQANKEQKKPEPKKTPEDLLKAKKTYMKNLLMKNGFSPEEAELEVESFKIEELSKDQWLQFDLDIKAKFAKAKEAKDKVEEIF